MESSNVPSSSPEKCLNTESLGQPVPLAPSKVTDMSESKDADAMQLDDQAGLAPRAEVSDFALAPLAQHGPLDLPNHDYPANSMEIEASRYIDRVVETLKANDRDPYLVDELIENIVLTPLGENLTIDVDSWAQPGPVIGPDIKDVLVSMDDLVIGETQSLNRLESSPEMDVDPFAAVYHDHTYCLPRSSFRQPSHSVSVEKDISIVQFERTPDLVPPPPTVSLDSEKKLASADNDWWPQTGPLIAPRKNPNTMIDWKSMAPRWHGKQSDWQKFCTKLLQEMHSIRNKGFAQIFYFRVDPIRLKSFNYLDIITNPMDLQTIKKKLDFKQYAEPEEFKQDILLMVENCCTYNPEGSSEYQNGLDMKAFFDSKWGSCPRPSCQADIQEPLVINTDLMEKITSYVNVVRTEKCAKIKGFDGISIKNRAYKPVGDHALFLRDNHNNQHITTKVTCPSPDSQSDLQQALVINTDLMEDEKINSYINAVKAEEQKCAEKLELLRNMSEGLCGIAMKRREAKLAGDNAPILQENQLSQLDKLGITIKPIAPIMMAELVSPAVSVRSSGRAPVPKIIDDIGPAPIKSRKISRPRSSTKELYMLQAFVDAHGLPRKCSYLPYPTAPSAPPPTPALKDSCSQAH